jgi:hypothetical protein
VKTGCRIEPGVYTGKGYLTVGPITGSLVGKNQISLNQDQITKPVIQGTCRKSDVAAPFLFAPRLDDSQPQWILTGKPPVIGMTTTFHRKLKEGDATYNDAFDITVKVKMRTAKSGTVSITENYVIHSNQQGSMGRYTSTCIGKGKFDVKR